MSALSDFRPTSHFPVGALQPTLANDTTQLPAGWQLLDGSLLSRSAYPEAAEMFGDVRLCDATAVSTAIPPPGGVATYSGSTPSGIVRGDAVLLGAGGQFSSSSTSVFVLRSIDCGENFSAIWIPVGVGLSGFEINLQWLGGTRVLAIFRGTPSAGGAFAWWVSCSSDMGATWTAPSSISLHADVQWFVGNQYSCGTDAQVPVDGSGHAYIGAPSYANGGTIVAVHVATGKVISFTVAKDGSTEARPMVVTGRALAGGDSEVLYGYTTSAGRKYYLATINAQTGTVQQNGSASLSYGDAETQSGGRFWTMRGGDGNDYFATEASGGVYKIAPSLLSGLATSIMVTPDAGRRLLDNVIAGVTGVGYDISTGRAVRRLATSILAHYGGSALSASSKDIWSARPSSERFVASVGGIFASWDWRTVTGFFSKLSSIADASRYLAIEAGFQGVRWYDSATGIFRAVVRESSTVLRVRAYMPAEDYGQYLQAPWFSGMACKLK